MSISVVDLHYSNKSSVSVRTSMTAFLLLFYSPNTVADVLLSTLTFTPLVQITSILLG